MAKIRLALVRCDTHGYYFGAMLAPCDPLLLQKNDYVVHHYFSDIYDPKRLTMPRVRGFDLVKVYDYRPEKAEAFAETFLGTPQVCGAVEEMTEGMDAAFICDCDGGGGDHLRLATPFLEKGIPTFVDKPFASSLNDARAIIQLAEKHHAPLFNSSILSVVPAADQFQHRVNEILGAYWPVPSSLPSAASILGVVKGVGGAFSQELKGKAITGGLEERLAYVIHGIALGINLFGNGVDWVECMGTLPLEYLHMHLKRGVEILVMNTSIDLFPESCSFYAAAYSKFGAVHSPPIGDPEFIGGGAQILRRFKKMIQTRKPPVPYEDILEHIAVVEAGQIAQQQGGRVYLENL